MRKRRAFWGKIEGKKMGQCFIDTQFFLEGFLGKKKRKILFFAFFLPNSNTSYSNYSSLSDDNTVSIMARAESLLVPIIKVSPMKA